MKTPLIPVTKLADRLGIDEILVKREDLNRSGSHKDRAIWPVIEEYVKQGNKTFVVSSSGNTAISAAFFVTNIDRTVKVHVFLSPSIPFDKKKRLNEFVLNFDNIEVHETSRAKSEAIRFAKENHYQLIRTSVDDLVLEGYEVLADEILNQLRNTKSKNETIDIFVPTSSGSTFQGLYNGFYLGSKGIEVSVRLHAVQTSKCNVVVRKFDKYFETSNMSLASAIVDTIGYRKEKVEEAINKSNGGGWVISDNELFESRKVFEECVSDMDISWDSLLSLAGLIRAVKSGRKINRAILLVTGK